VAVADESGGPGGRGLVKLDGKDLVPEARAFAEYLRDLRARTGLKSSRLEAELGMPAGGLSRYLSGERVPKPTWLRRLHTWIDENVDGGLPQDERDRGRDLLYQAGLAKDLLVAHQIELEKLDVVWAARIEAVEQDIDDIRTQLKTEREARERNEDKVAELEERLAQLEKLAALLEAERAALAAMTGAVDDNEQVTALAVRQDGPLPPIWGMVPLRNPDFVGRTGLIRVLRQRLFPQDGTPARPLVLHGLGGVGKTQLVVEYVHTHAPDYHLVCWIPSEHPTQIRSAYVDLAKKLGIKASNAETAVTTVRETLRTFDEDRRWLLVFDNADDAAVIRPYLPAGRGQVVITSRNPYWEDVARPLEVDLFTRTESVELVRLRSPGISAADAATLAEALGDLPLALSQLGSWLDQTGTSVRECLRLLEETGTELLRFGGDSEYELPVAAAWNVPLNRLRNHDDPVALKLLELCAFFAPVPISRSLLAGVPRALDLDIRDGIKLNAAIRLLTRQSLVKVDHRDQSLSLHPMLRAVLRDNVPREDQDAGCSG
jgi:transcriptional regulator with XRE-family HTH domain